MGDSRLTGGVVGGRDRVAVVEGWVEVCSTLIGDWGS